MFLVVHRIMVQKRVVIRTLFLVIFMAVMVVILFTIQLMAISDIFQRRMVPCIRMAVTLPITCLFKQMPSGSFILLLLVKLLVSIFSIQLGLTCISVLTRVLHSKK